MATESFTEDDMNRMYRQHLKDEFARNGESITEKKEDFKRQLREARGEHLKSIELDKLKPANENQKQQKEREGLNNSHNSGQGQKTEQPKDEKEVKKQKFKDMLREARGEQITKQEKQFDANSKDVAGDKQKQKETEFKKTGKEITQKKQEPKDRGGKYTPQPPTPGKDFTRTFGRDRD